MSEVLVRRAVAADIAGVAALWKELAESFWRKTGFRPHVYSMYGEV